jgi:hypothetical protein
LKELLGLRAKAVFEVKHGKVEIIQKGNEIKRPDKPKPQQKKRTRCMLLAMGLRRRS